MNSVLMSLLIPFLLSIVLRSRSARKIEERGVTMEAGEGGIVKRNKRFLTLVETPWEGATTLAALFQQACMRYASQPLLGTRELVKAESVIGADGRPFEKMTYGEYKWLSYKEAFEVVSSVASGLAALGHGKDEKCAIFAETQAEWFLSLQACFRRNISVVTVYASLGEEALVHSLMETRVSTVICDHKQFQKMVEMRQHIDAVKRVVLIGGQGNTSVVPAYVCWKVVSFSEVEQLGKEFPLQADLPAAADVAVIMYTSGSTGLPKGVIMTHGNLVATVAGVLCLIPNLSIRDKYLAYLPLAHVFELAGENIMCAGGVAIGYGSPFTLTDASSKIKKGTKGDASELKPTLIITVPAILDRIRDGIKKMIESKGGLTKTVFELAYRRRLAAIEGSWLGAWGLEKILWDVIVFKNVKAVLGGHVRAMLSGGAPLSGDTQRFVNVCFGIPVLQGYGLTETCAGGTFSEWNDTTVCRTGPPIPHCYVKLINWEEGGYKINDKPFPRGEIVVGGPSVSPGYFKNQAKTDEMYKVDECGLRWFHTGDIGQFHPDGSLEIIDRKKDIVKLQHGEYVSLGKVEAILSVCPYVESIMVHANPFNSYCVALVVVSHPAIENWAQKEKIHYNDFSDLCGKEDAVKEVLTALHKLGKSAKLGKFEIPSRIKLLHEPWTPEAGLVTVALKLKRENLRKEFSSDLKALYS